MKRLVLATLFGLVAGCICSAAGIWGGIMKPTALAFTWVFLNRGLMGFIIGASSLRLPWAWNGVVLGMAVGSIFSYSLFLEGHTGALPVINFFVNGIFGLLIEFFTTVVFHEPAASRVHLVQRTPAVRA